MSEERGLTTPSSSLSPCRGLTLVWDPTPPLTSMPSPRWYLSTPDSSWRLPDTQTHERHVVSRFLVKASRALCLQLCGLLTKQHNHTESQSQSVTSRFCSTWLKTSLMRITLLIRNNPAVEQKLSQLHVVCLTSYVWIKKPLKLLFNIYVFSVL